MKNGRITYRFDNGKRMEHEREQEDNVIPLRGDEYEVKRELRPDGTGGAHVHSPAPSQPRTPEFIDTQTLNQYTTDYGAWKSPFDAEAERVEKLIRDSQPERRHEAETGYYGNHNPGYIEHGMQEREPLRDHRFYVPDEPVRYGRSGRSGRGPGSWLKITTSVAGAVITGVAFGFFVLSMFSGDPEQAKDGTKTAAGTAPSSSVTTPGAAASSAAGQTTSKPTTAAAAGTSAAATVSVAIPGKTYSFLQSGVFSTQQSADAAQADLKKKGFGAAGDIGDKFPVYGAMALTRDDALLLGQQFQQKKVDVIIKNIDVPALAKVKFNGKQPEQLQSYMSQGDKLVQLLSALSLKHLNEQKPSAPDAAALQTIKTAHQSWSTAAASVQEGLTEDAKALQQKMATAMNTAVMSFDEYKKNQASSYLWQAQTSLMQYTLADKELRKAITAQ